MKRFLLFLMVVGLLAGQACAATFSLDGGELMSLKLLEFENYGVLMDGPTTDISYAGANPMIGDVGYAVLLGDRDVSDADTTAWAKWGYAPSISTNLTGYSEYRLLVANDDNSDWYAQLHLSTLSAGETKSDKMILAPGDSAVLSIALAGISGLNDVTNMGFYMGSDFMGVGGEDPSRRDVSHMSVAHAPIPGAVILGLLGMGVACLKLRKRA